VGDFNGDGHVDLATANAGSDTVSILLGRGDGTFHTTPDITIGEWPQSVTVGDFNGDGHVDLAAANGGNSYPDGTSDSVSIILGVGDGTFRSAQKFRVGDFPSSVTVADFNGDGRLDLVTANGGSDAVSILLGRGNGTFRAAQDFGVGNYPYSVTVGDFNGDGRVDLATADAGSDTVSVLLGRGDGTFREAFDFRAGHGAFSVTVDDFNADGRSDLAVANDIGIVSILLGVVLIANPGVGLVATVWTIGAYAVLFGLLMLALAFLCLMSDRLFSKGHAEQPGAKLLG
jgi:hypothetical protein